VINKNIEKSQHGLPGKKNVLAWRMIIAILLFSSFITLISTAMQLYIEYRRDISGLLKDLDQISTSHVDAVASSLWGFDTALIKTQLEGMHRIQDVEYLAVYDESRLLVDVGRKVDKYRIIQETPLLYNDGTRQFKLGKLIVEASLGGAYKRLTTRLLLILSTQATKTFLVSTFIFILFYRMVGQHLSKMADFARALRLDTLSMEMNLGRLKPEEGKRAYDELDEVETAFNEMRKNLENDIQRRREAETALKKSEERYRRLVLNIPGIVYRHNLLRDQIEFISPSIKQLTGHTDSDFMAGTIRYSELIHPDDNLRVLQTIRKSREDTSSYEVEYRLVGEGDELHIVHEFGVVIHEDDGQSVWVDGVLFEVTKRRETERRLDETSTLIRTLVEVTTDAIFVKDLKGRYLLANSAALQAMGKDESEVIGRTDADVFPAATAAVIAEVDKKVLKSGKAQIHEERIESAYGDSYWLSNKCPLVGPDGKAVGMIGISRNITEAKLAQLERESLENRLHQAQKMEAIGTLAGGIAHDFNNILSVIVGYCEIMQDDPVIQAAASKEIANVLQAAYRARDLVQQILAFSRRADEKPVSIQPASGVKEGLKLLRSTIPTTIELAEDIDPNCAVITIDPTQLHQVLMNLCTNAYHVLRKTGGRITVSLFNRSVHKGQIVDLPEVEGDFVELDVKDDGPGIDPGIVGRIFEPYFTTKDVGEGTGMGLAIVHGIVNKCGGYISCESYLGQGAVFRVFFPATISSDVAQSADKQLLSMGTEHILFVDDEKILLDMGKEMMERMGYRVTSFSRSVEALAAFQKDPDSFDLMLSDQTMPELSGVNLAKQVLRIRPELPIILCTGYSAVVSEETAHDIGIKAYVHKPLLKRQLSQLLRELLDARKNRA
jgi:PAS domain S-box-containing protein